MASDFFGHLIPGDGNTTDCKVGFPCEVFGRATEAVSALKMTVNANAKSQWERTFFVAAAMATNYCLLTAQKSTTIG